MGNRGDDVHGNMASVLLVALYADRVPTGSARAQNCSMVRAYDECITRSVCEVLRKCCSLVYVITENALQQNQGRQYLYVKLTLGHELGLRWLDG